MNMLKMLHNERIVSITLTSDKKALQLQEACDYYFDVSIDKVEVEVLIKELQVLHDEMI